MADYLGIHESSEVYIILILFDKIFISTLYAPIGQPCIHSFCGYKTRYRGHDTKDDEQSTRMGKSHMTIR